MTKHAKGVSRGRAAVRKPKPSPTPIANRGRAVVACVTASPDKYDLLDLPGRFSLLVLCATAVLGDDAYATRIADWFKEMFPKRKEVTPGQISGAAKSLSDRGLLVCEPRGLGPSAFGRPVVVYRLTPSGEAMVRSIYRLTHGTTQEENPHVPRTQASAGKRPPAPLAPGQSH